MAFFAVLSLLFLAVLVVGLQQGELRLPADRFGVRIQRASNPLGFYFTAALYAGLAGVASYPLWLLLRDGRGSRVPRTPVPQGRLGAGLDLSGRVSVQSDGRAGTVRLALDAGGHDFWWEFGGGDCLAIVTVPSAAEWARVPALAAHDRDAFLDALAREVTRLQCPNARYEIEPQAIVFRNP